MAETDLCHQTLEAGTALDRGTRPPQIIVDHHDRCAVPAKLQRPIHQSILQPRRFLVSLNLLKRGLANVDYRHPLPMPTVDLVRHHAVGRRTPNLAHHDWTPRPQPPRGSGEVSSASVHAAPCVAGRRATSAIPVDRPRSSRDPSQRTSARSASRPSMGGPGELVKLSAVSWMGYRMQLTRQQGPALRHGSGHHPCQIPRAA